MPAALAEALRPELMKYFKPAFLGRVTLVPYFPLSDGGDPPDRRTAARAHPRSGCARPTAPASSTTPALVETIAARCTESSSGARNIEKILSRTLLPELSAEVLARLGEGAADRPRCRRNGSTGSVLLQSTSETFLMTLSRKREDLPWPST